MRGNHQLYHVTLWPRCHMRSRDKLKTQYLLLCKAYGHQTWQDGGLWWGKPTHNVRWPSDHVITWVYVTNWKLISSIIRGLLLKWRIHLYINIFSSASSMTTKHGDLVTCGEKSPPMESHDPLTKWWFVVTWQIKSVTDPPWKGLWPWNLASWWLMARWTHPWCHMSLWPPGHMKSRDKLKTKYFFF